MYKTAIFVILFAAILESLIIIAGNMFTIFVFWKNRNSLKRTTCLLINLAVADLFTGFAALLSLGAFKIPGHFKERNFETAHDTNISMAFQITFSFASVLLLALISLERAYALIWPLRHRVASTRGYIYGATFGWITAIFGGVLTLLAVYDVLDFSYWVVAIGCVKILCLVTVCVSYLLIRTRLNSRAPTIDGANNRQIEQQQNAKLSKTLFIVITASLSFWVPSIVVFCTRYLCNKCVPSLVIQFVNLFSLANSLVNPIIYSFRIPMFKKIFKRLQLCKKSKRYTVNHMGWYFSASGRKQKGGWQGTLSEMLP